MSDVTPAPQPEDAPVERTDEVDGVEELPEGQVDGYNEDGLDTGEPFVTEVEE